MTRNSEHDPLGDLSEAGVAVWLDDLSRELLAGGGLQRLVATRHVVGVTTNPTIFASALANGDRYDDQLAHLADLRASVDATGDTITAQYAASRQTMNQLAAAGIDFDDVTDHLERDGLAKFEKSWTELGATVAAELQQQRTTAR
jgi:transaldolase